MHPTATLNGTRTLQLHLLGERKSERRYLKSSLIRFLLKFCLPAHSKDKKNVMPNELNSWGKIRRDDSYSKVISYEETKPKGVEITFHFLYSLSQQGETFK